MQKDYSTKSNRPRHPPGPPGGMTLPDVVGLTFFWGGGVPSLHVLSLGWPGSQMIFNHLVTLARLGLRQRRLFG